jgi:hypothetical protein
MLVLVRPRDAAALPEHGARAGLAESLHFLFRGDRAGGVIAKTASPLGDLQKASDEPVTLGRR